MLYFIEKWNNTIGAWFSTGDCGFNSALLEAKAERIADANGARYRVITVVWGN